MNKEEMEAYIAEALRNGSTIRYSDMAYADVDTINVREKMSMPELDLEKFGRPSEDAYESCCGNCCWFYGEMTCGDGFCAKAENSGYADFFHCSDKCRWGKIRDGGSLEYAFVSKKEMRHHMAVLLQLSRYGRDNSFPPIYMMPDPIDNKNAMEFAFKYMKVFSKL